MAVQKCDKRDAAPCRSLVGNTGIVDLYCFGIKWKEGGNMKTRHIVEKTLEYYN